MTDRAARGLAWTGAGLLTLLWIRNFQTAPWSQDEGLYLLFARLVSEGKKPYFDFSYQQTPLYPYLLSAWGWIFGTGHFGGRWLSLVSLFGSFWLSYRLLTGAGIARSWSLAALFLIGLHPLVWNYFVLLKPYALTMFLLLVGVFGWRQAGSRAEGVWDWLGPPLSGLALGLAAGIRTNFLLAIPLIGFLFCLNSFGGSRAVGRMLLFFGAALLPLLPVLWFWLTDGELFWFNVVRYAELRSSLRGWAAWTQRWATVEAALFYPASLLTLAWAALVLLFGRKRSFLSPERRRISLVWLGCGVLLTAPFFRLSPFYDEYLAHGFWLSVLAVVCLIPAFRFEKALAIVFVVVAGFVWAVSFRSWLPILWDTGADTRSNSIVSVAEVSRAIRARTTPGEEILTFWNGYAVASDRNLPPGVEQGLAIVQMAGKLSSLESRRYRIAAPEEVRRWVETRRTRWVIVGLGSPKGFEELVRQFYRFAGTFGGAAFYSSL